MTVNRYATAAGRKYQRDLMKYLRDECGHDAEQLVLSGAEDEGDILLRVPDAGLVKTGPGQYAMTDVRYVIEAKREKGFHLAEWVRQAETESLNYATHRGVAPADIHFAVVHARRHYGIAQSYVTLPLYEWLRQIT